MEAQEKDSGFQFFARRTIKFFLYGILILSLVSACVCFVIYPTRYSDVFSFKDFIFVIPGALLMIGVFSLGKRMLNWSTKLITTVMVLSEIVIALALLLTYNTQPCVDYRQLWETACEYAVGDYTASLTPGDYMHYWNWQIGIAYLESLIIRVFGSNFNVLKIINAIIVILMDHAIFRLCLRKADKKVACYAYALSTFFMPWFLTIPQFTNHHATILLLMLIFWLLDTSFQRQSNNLCADSADWGGSKNSWISVGKWVLAGFLSAILNLIRPYGILLVLSMMCLGVYKTIVVGTSPIIELGRINRVKNAIRIVICIVLFIAVYYAMTAGINLYFRHIGLADYNVTEPNLPYYKFQQGLYGISFSAPRAGLEAVNFNYDVYNENVKAELMTMITNRSKEVIVFVCNKMCRYLGLWDYQFEMTYNHDVAFYTTYPVRALYSTSWFQYLIVVGLALVGLKKYRLWKVDIYNIFFIGITLVYLFIEAFSSYRFESYVVIVFLAGNGMKAVEEHLKSKKYGGLHLPNAHPRSES